ncbi:hypothetical protein [Atlantibacter sp.]|uniref:hypothetical protein n=1 Tax=Atlantibacter sp. TaxID=1903473 RepID=UPI0028B0423F|nr:hypothetical protein [Atlantibacter sp.]
MKKLSLKQAMLGMRVVLTDNGTIIKSPAGSAEYDLKGRRIKVNGYPEYFPGQLCVKDKRTPKRVTMDMTNGMLTVRDGDGTLRVQMGKVFISDASIQPFKIQSANIGDRIMSGQDAGWHLNKSGVLNDGGSSVTKCHLSDDMREAVLDAVRNSDLFQSLVEQVNVQSAAHASTVISLQKGIEQALNDTIRNALQPGGLLYRASR